jgi:CheY-like chemotaxis protein
MATILLVEDHDDLREGIRVRLEVDHHRVVEAADGEEAIQCWRSLTLDLIITDFKMPRMDGLEVIKGVSAQQPALPILLISGRIEDQLRMRILSSFCSVRYLPKQCVSTHLRQYVAASLT